MFGRDQWLPINQLMGPGGAQDYQPDSWVTRHQNELRDAHRRAADRLAREAEACKRKHGKHPRTKLTSTSWAVSACQRQNHMGREQDPRPMGNWNSQGGWALGQWHLCDRASWWAWQCQSGKSGRVTGVPPLLCYRRLLVRWGDHRFPGEHSDQNPLMMTASLGLPLGLPPPAEAEPNMPRPVNLES